MAEELLVEIKRRLEFPSGPLASGQVWVGGRVLDNGDLVIVYRGAPHLGLLGSIYDLREYARMFDPDKTVEELALDIYMNEITDPSYGLERYLDIDWADGGVENPSEIGWV